MLKVNLRAGAATGHVRCAGVMNVGNMVATVGSGPQARMSSRLLNFWAGDYFLGY